MVDGELNMLLCNMMKKMFALFIFVIIIDIEHPAYKGVNSQN